MDVVPFSERVLQMQLFEGGFSQRKSIPFKFQSKSSGGLCKSSGGLCKSSGGLCKRRGGLCKRRDGLYKRRGGL